MSQLDQLLRESGLGAEDPLARLLAPLEELRTTAPEPSPELADSFAGVRLALVRASRAARATRLAAGAAVATALSLGGAGLAAAANTLPAPLQDRVSEFSHRYLPFEFPRPTPQDLVPVPPTGAPAQEQSRAERAAPLRPLQRPTHHEEAAADTQDASGTAAAVPAVSPRVRDDRGDEVPVAVTPAPDKGDKGDAGSTGSTGKDEGTAKDQDADGSTAAGTPPSTTTPPATSTTPPETTMLAPLPLAPGAEVPVAAKRPTRAGQPPADGEEGGRAVKSAKSAKSAMAGEDDAEPVDVTDQRDPDVVPTPPATGDDEAEDAPGAPDVPVLDGLAVDQD